MERGFWDSLNKPIFALSPMDGVTDAAFRSITDRYGKPHILFTEFTPVEAIKRGATRVLEAFLYHKTATPTVAQIYGTELDGYYQSAIVVAEMGFDGVDINMGCPARNVSHRGAGAGLIQTPELAQQIIRTTQDAMRNWANGQTMEEAGVHRKTIAYVGEFKSKYGIESVRRLLPVSVKTRIGFSHPVTEEWIKTLLETEPVNISLHGRTLKQMYTGHANWEEIGKAAEVVKATKTTLLGNGDVQSLEDAKAKVTQYGVDGVLIGRATFGNPWIFQGTEVDAKTRLSTALEHTELFADMLPEANFLSMRKHLAWYCRGFANAVEVRSKLMQVSRPEDLRRILAETQIISH